MSWSDPEVLKEMEAIAAAAPKKKKRGDTVEEIFTPDLAHTSIEARTCARLMLAAGPLIEEVIRLLENGDVVHARTRMHGLSIGFATLIAKLVQISDAEIHDKFFDMMHYLLENGQPPQPFAEPKTKPRRRKSHGRRR